MSKRKNWYRKLSSRSFWSDKRAVSVALTTLIITAGVVAAGISVLYWAYSWGNVANEQYSEHITSSQNATSERLAFEYVTFSQSQLKVYLINCGQVPDVRVVRLYIWDSSSQLVGSFPTDDSPMSDLMHTSEPGSAIAGNRLGKGEEGYFTISNLNLNSGYYTLRVVTERGRSFDSTFSV